ncbi:hypothetical protein Air01nite_76970 [Asanoa iriomotensis]|uniref:Uncharacterized protein n=1 Tax=Asanoa iriomotensis TaxID=234613 RepID=A0ABQ4CFQ2_9ACTN|nr:hypothetical protein Air01nite_76970 [Asanoa iriomotensis]
MSAARRIGLGDVNQPPGAHPAAWTGDSPHFAVTAGLPTSVNEEAGPDRTVTCLLSVSGLAGASRLSEWS